MNKRGLQLIKHRWLCAISLLFVGVLPIVANTGDYFYYKTTAYASPTGGGKVYVSTTSTNNPDYRTGSHSISGSSYNVNSASLTFYFYAQANNNWIFDHWAEGSATGTSVSTNPSYNVSLTFNSTSERNPTTFNYYAVFRQQTGLIKVKSSDESKGSVSISNPDNTEGQDVTLTANPDVSNGIMFLGWKKNNTGDYISTENPWTLTANSETEGTYYAYFSDAADKVYIRLKNNKTGRFISFYGNTTASSHTRSFDNNTAKDGFIFTNSLKMIEAADAQGNPETVFLRTGHNAGTGVMNGVDLMAHEVKYSTLVGANTSNNDKMLIIENRNGKFRIFTPFKFDDNGTTITISSYLCDEGRGKNGDFAIMKTDVSNDGEADWTLYSLDETTNEGAFGANTKEKYKKEGEDGTMYYYTTMYTDFPYRMLDGVNAYYLVFNAEFTEITDRIVFTQVDGDIVPANTAVILECKEIQNDASSNTVKNRLLPLLPGTEGTEQIVNPDANFLKGYISVNGSREVNDKKQKYILSYKNDKLGFYHSSADYMTPNKAYLLTPEATEEQREYYSKNVTFSFGFPEDEEIKGVTTDIILSDEIVNEADDTYYDLQGRKVKHPTNGVYIREGKKYVIK